jgi:hypothetical protein
MTIACRCPKCSAIALISTAARQKGSFACLACRRESGTSKWTDRKASLVEVAKVGLDEGVHADPHRRVVSGSVVTSTGFAKMPPGLYCLVDFHRVGVSVYPDQHTQGAPVGTLFRYADVRSLSVGGRGTVTTRTGGGWVGGGFGIDGAVEGASMAALFNALTTKTKTSTETLVHLNAGTHDLVLLNQSITPLDLQTRLAPVFARLEDAHRIPVAQPEPGQAKAGPDPVEQLERLAALRDRGVVTAEEFDRTKADLLRRLSLGE